MKQIDTQDRTSHDVVELVLQLGVLEAVELGEVDHVRKVGRVEVVSHIFVINQTF